MENNKYTMYSNDVNYTEWFEEFKEYETLWESTEVDGATYLMWTLPHGEKIDLADISAIKAEKDKFAKYGEEFANKRRQLESLWSAIDKLEHGVYNFRLNHLPKDSDYIKYRLNMHKNVYDTLMEVRKNLLAIANEERIVPTKEIARVNKHTDAIIDELQKYTDLADKVDLEDVRRQLNMRATTDYKKKLQNRLDKLSEKLKEYYSELLRYGPEAIERFDRNIEELKTRIDTIKQNQQVGTDEQ